MAKTATAPPTTRATLRRNAGTAGDGFRCREATPGRAGDGLSYRAGVRDTIEPPVGRGERAQSSPRRWVLLVHQAATTRTYQAA